MPYRPTVSACSTAFQTASRCRADAQFSIDETLEFNDYYYNGGVPGAEKLSRQLEGFNPVNFPYRWVRGRVRVEV